MTYRLSPRPYDPPEYHWTKRDFTTWLRENATHLRGYAPDEVATLARFCGFELGVICPGITDQMARFERLLRFWQSEFNEQWLSLKDYCARGRDWGDA